MASVSETPSTNTSIPRVTCVCKPTPLKLTTADSLLYRSSVKTPGTLLSISSIFLPSVRSISFLSIIYTGDPILLMVVWIFVAETVISPNPISSIFRENSTLVSLPATTSILDRVSVE